MGPYIKKDIVITNVRTNTAVGLGETALFCKACQAPSGSDKGVYAADTCWGILPADNTDFGQGCNGGGWAGKGVYYGTHGTRAGNKVHWRYNGGFAGEKQTGQGKGDEAGAGLEIYESSSSE